MSGPRGDDVVLSVNCGSSSLKVGVFIVDDVAARSTASAAVDRIGHEGSEAWVELGGARTIHDVASTTDTTAVLTLIALLEKRGARAPTLVGHRVVHGGPQHAEPVLIDAAALSYLRGIAPMAPLHMAPAIEAIEAVAGHYPGLPQVACFDTAFHASMPDVARRLPLPDRFDRQGIHRYGFHGLSYEYILSVIGPLPPRRMIIAHLGGGSSLVAVKDGRAIDTTMGFTPTGGVMMGTRTGDLDPGLLIYLQRSENLSVDALESLVTRDSGLGAVGGASDMKTLVLRAPSDARAQLAVAMFVYGVRKAIGSLTAALGGVDLLVFTGGIGEHTAEVRAGVCEGLEYLGIELDADRNARADERISRDSSRCTVRVIATNEDLVIARHTRRVARGYRLQSVH